MVYFCTIRIAGSRLWFVNNKPLQRKIVSYLARYVEMYGVEVYAFVIEGNHYHLLARFPNLNRAAFMRSFNSMVARLVESMVPGYRHGRLWARRYSAEAVPTDVDVLDRFFYCALNSVNAGLGEQFGDNQTFNSFNQAATGRSTLHKIFCRWEYNKAKLAGLDPDPSHYVVWHTLTFKRLPGMEDLSAQEYEITLRQELETRRQEIVLKRRAAGGGFLTRKQLRETIPGAFPKNTKSTTEETGRRPVVLTKDPVARQQFLIQLSAFCAAYREASIAYRAGIYDTPFPEGSYRPPLGMAGRSGPEWVKRCAPPALQH